MWFLIHIISKCSNLQITRLQINAPLASGNDIGLLSSRYQKNVEWNFNSKSHKLFDDENHALQRSPLYTQPAIFVFLVNSSYRGRNLHCNLSSTERTALDLEGYQILTPSIFMSWENPKLQSTRAY